MKLVKDARILWHRFWSVRFSAVASIMGSIAAVLSFVGERNNSLPFIVLASVFSAAAGIARVVDQPKLRNKYGRSPE